MKTIKKTVLALGIIAGLSVASTSFAGFGLPSLPSIPGVGAASSGPSASSIDAFVATGQKSNELISNARLVLASALSTKEERAKLLQQQEQIKKGLASGDKKATDENQQFQASLDAEIAAKARDDKSTEQLKSLSAEQSKQVISSLQNLGLGILTQREQVAAGKNMVASIAANPMLATKLPAVKDTVSTMTDNLKGTAGYIISLPKLFKSAGLSVAMPTDTSSKPAELADAAALFSPN